MEPSSLSLSPIGSQESSIAYGLALRPRRKWLVEDAAARRPRKKWLTAERKSL